jgi:hypothetical protein
VCTYCTLSRGDGMGWDGGGEREDEEGEKY